MDDFHLFLRLLRKLCTFSTLLSGFKGSAQVTATLANLYDLHYLIFNVDC